jgi:hypothetical protein
MEELLIPLLILGMAVSVLSLLVTKAGITGFVRDFFENRFGEDSLLLELFSCPFCMSFWLTIPVDLVYRFVPIESDFPPMDYFIGYLCIIGVAAFFSGIIYGLISKIE